MLGSIAEGRPRILDGAGFPAADRPSAHAPLVKTSRILDSGNCFHALVDMVADCAIYILDADGIVVSWNAGAERIKGYSAAEIIGRHFSCFFIEEERSAERPAELLKITDQIGRYEEEGWRVRKDGSRFRAHALVHPIRDPDGRLAGFAKITRDLTERDRTVEALRRSEDRFRRVVEAAPNAMVMIDRNGRIEMINAQTERVFGYSRAELMSQPVELLVPERFRCHHPGLRKAFFDDPRPRPMRAGHDLYGLRKDGSEFPVEIGLSPIETDEGIMVLSAIVDVSARKREEGLVRASLKEKDILLGEIHHRVKNNLQIVDSLLGLKSGKINDGAIQEILRESRNRIK